MAHGARVVVVGGGDLLVGVGAAGEGHSHRARALLSVPWKLACCWGNVNEVQGGSSGRIVGLG